MKSVNQNIIENFNDLLGEEKVKVDEPMNRHTTFRIGGPADYFLLPSSEEELSGILKICKNEELPYFILGNGYPLPIRFTQNVLLYSGISFSGTNGNFFSFAAFLIESNDLSTHFDTTGDSTSVSVFIMWIGLTRCLSGKPSIAIQTSCSAAVLSFPPEYPIIHGISSDKYRF